MHRMLLRQLNRFFGPVDSVPAHLRNFINSVDEAYEASEAEQKHLVNAYDQAARDLVERNRLLAQRSKELEALKQCAVDGVIVADFEGRIVDANPAAQAMLGRSLLDLRGQVVYEAIIPDQHREGHSQLIARHLSGHETGVSRIETRCLRPGTGEFPVEMAITVVRGEGPSQIVVCFRDISGRKQAAPQAEAPPPPPQPTGPSPDVVIRLTGQLHEPLQQLITSVEKLEETPLSGPQRHYVETLHGAAETTVRLLTRLLEHSTAPPPAEAQAEVSRVAKEFELSRIIEAMVDTLSPEAAKKRLEFAYSVNPDVPNAVIGDPQRFDQVLHNLVSNAIKFTDHGEVSVQVTASEQTDSEVTVRCAVKDSGRGIPQDQLEKLYKQLSDPSSAWSQSGHGLAIAQQLITAMGGTLGMESQPGQGSTFWFTVRMHKQHVHSAHDSDGPMIRGTEGMRVLVVDDNATNLAVMKEQLSGWKMSVQTAPGGSEALKLLLDGVVANRPFDVAVIDYEMPGMDGIELGRTIRAIPSFRRIPMILLRPSTAMVNDMMLKDGGFSVCIAKPLRPAQLHDAIDQAMSSPAAPATGSVTAYEQEQDPKLQAKEPPPPGPMKLDVVIEKCMGDLSYLERILYKFQDQSDETVKRIIQCLNARDKEGAIQLISALRGAAEYLGADDLRDHAAHVEELTRLGVFNETLNAMVQLKEEVFRCIDYIPELLHQAASRKEAA
ncbi:MAG TPA: ATP-binding protein [Tepidisphaeraceae bacterium]|nr:ATP-binding protein [Tepidisphaeraceae bacterium]